jgi:hypothetical protein
MILLFADEGRAYLSLGLPVADSPGDVEPVTTSRIQVSNCDKLTKVILRTVQVEQPRSKTHFKTIGHVDAPAFNPSALSAPNHQGFAIFRTPHGIAFQGIHRLPNGAWEDWSSFQYDATFSPSDRDEDVALAAAMKLRCMLRQQREARRTL